VNSSQELFEKNCDLWARQFPNDAAKIRALDCSKTAFVKAANGSENLKHSDHQKTFFYHSETDPLKEAQEWFNGLHLSNVIVVYVFGIGLGYVYEAASKWLQGGAGRLLIFIEDQPEVVHRFLETKRASQFLTDPQAQLCLFEASQESWDALSSHLTMFSLHPYAVYASPYYQREFTQKAELNKSMFSFMATFNYLSMAEYHITRSIVLKNFYENSLKISDSYLVQGLLGAFKGVPAIVCGAGPSLDKNIDVLRTLSDRALIIAGGTGINAVEGGKVAPHLYVGIDPNPAQVTRMIMTQGYETPFLYRGRVNADALDLIHGEHLFIPGLIGYILPTWLGNQLGIGDVSFDDGLNVLNLSLNLAEAFGCNPIICVGIDLAYSAEASYASRIANHPLHERKTHFKTKEYQDELVTKLDINGKPIHTLWKWVGEALWYSGAKDRFPEATLINSTEGGIGFPDIPNIPLAQVKEQYLTKRYDFKTWLQGEVYQSEMPKSVTLEKIKNAFDLLAVSLKRCSGICQEIINVLSKGAKDSRELIEGLVQKLKEEEGYKGFLQTYDEAYRKMFLLESSRLEWFKDNYTPEGIENHKTALDLNHYEHLRKIAMNNGEMIEEALAQKNDLSSQQAAWMAKEGNEIQKKLKEEYPLFHLSDEVYAFENGILTMSDPELDLNVSMPFVPDDFLILNYPNGSAKLQHYFLGGELHGPSSFYHPDGALMARAWFNRGKRVGKMLSYYASGEFHSVQRFVDGQAHGMQEYFYRDGLPRSRLPYDKGLLNGEVFLFSNCGRLSRSLQYERGLRHGVEKIWDPFGRLRIEAHYANDRPIETAREWHANGQLGIEMVYDGDSNLVEKNFFDLEGNRTIETLFMEDVYFDEMAKELNNLTDSLGTVVRDLNTLTPQVSTQVDLQKEIKFVQEELLKMQELSSQMEKVLHSDAVPEPLWKDLSLQKAVEAKVQEQGKQLSEELAKIEANMAELMRALKKPFPGEQEK